MLAQAQEAVRGVHQRRLQQNTSMDSETPSTSPSDTYTMTLTATRCTTGQEVVDATDVIAALTYGGGLGGAKISLTQSNSNSNM